jgi:hypothetical protein
MCSVKRGYNWNYRMAQGKHHIPYTITGAQKRALEDRYKLPASLYSQ